MSPRRKRITPRRSSWTNQNITQPRFEIALEYPDPFGGSESALISIDKHTGEAHVRVLGVHNPEGETHGAPKRELREDAELAFREWADKILARYKRG